MTNICSFFKIIPVKCTLNQFFKLQKDPKTMGKVSMNFQSISMKSLVFFKIKIFLLYTSFSEALVVFISLVTLKSMEFILLQ